MSIPQYSNVFDDKHDPVLAGVDRRDLKCPYLAGDEAKLCWELAVILHRAESDVSRWAPGHQSLVYRQPRPGRSINY
jgi:hypothetical protein